MKREIVVTGIGIVCALGKKTEEVWDSLSKGVSGINLLKGLSSNGNPTRLGAEVKDFNAREFFEPRQRKQFKVMSRDVLLSVVAAKFAMESAGLNPEKYDPERFGVSIGSSLINNDLDELGIAFKAASENGRIVENRIGADVSRALFPLWMLKYLPNMPPCHISMAYDLRGPSNTITTEAASGIQAIGEGCRIIERGNADFMMVGSVDSKINGIALSKYDLLGLLSDPKDKDTAKYVPFSGESDFIIPGEASAILVLEEKETAKKRGAKIFAEIKGFGTTPITDIKSRAAKDVEGRALSLKKALMDAGVKNNDLDFVIANGMGIQQEDACELESMKRILHRDTPVTAIKPLTGYLGSGNGSVEVVAAILAMQNRLVPPIYGYQGGVDGVNLLEKPFDLSNKKSDQPIRCLVNSSSIVGQTASLIMECN